MTPKQQVQAHYPQAQCVTSDDNRACWIIVSDAARTRELGVSHGGRGRAWADAAAKLSN